MPTSRRKMEFQLYAGLGAADMVGAMIQATGGKVYVAVAGATQKNAITDKDGTALANPLALTNGSAEFYVLATVDTVDLYIQAPGGQFVVREGVSEGVADIAVDLTNRRQTYKIPFAIGDTAAATETDTGFDLPEDSMVLDRLHGAGVLVTALDATEDIDVGLGEAVPAESGGDANGFIAASDLDALGQVIGTNGALFSSNAPHKSNAVAARSITYTLTAGSDTAKGFILLPVILNGDVQ